MKNTKETFVWGKTIHGDELKCKFFECSLVFNTQILPFLILYRFINRKNYLLFSSLSFLKDI